MRIVSIEIMQVELPLRFSFKHAKKDRKIANNIIIRIHTEKGAIGYGEAIPREYLTGETIESIYLDLTGFLWERLQKIEFSFDRPIHEQLKPLYKEASLLRKTAAYAAIDIAVHEAAAQTRGLTVEQLFGLEINKKNNFTAPLGGNSVRSIKRNSRIFKFFGFKDFKLKTGLGNDIEKIKVARKIIGRDTPLRVDTNQCWSMKEAISIIPQLLELGVDVIEEPTADLQEMTIINKTFDAHIMADEKLCTYEDGLELVELGTADIWNLRLAKNGGYTGVIELMNLAKKNNIKLHLGVLVGETSLLSEAAIALASSPDFSFCEFGFPKILLSFDPYVNFKHGYFGKYKGFHGHRGFGIKLRYKRLKNYMRKNTTIANGVYIPPKPKKVFLFDHQAMFRE